MIRYHIIVDIDSSVKKTRYWIGVASRNHVMEGIHGGFANFVMAKLAPLKKLKIGDWIIYYSSKASFTESILAI